ncbi:MAG: hypothetical protein K2O18_02205 [Oscillospiraceae bacterium]|nr:hypothetical protein [Oscillospiraceae bacterium]
MEVRCIALGYDGVIKVDKLVNSSEFSKNLKKMSADLDKQVANMEKRLDDLRKKRDEALSAASVKNSRFDAELDKLNALQKELASLKNIAGNVKISAPVRDDAAAAVPKTEAELELQKVSVQNLREEYERVAESVEKYDAEISAVQAELESQRVLAQQYTAELAAAQTELLSLGDSAEIGNQRIVDLSHTLADLKKRQETLENAGLGLGFQEYDDNVRQINAITAELKAYQNSLNHAGTDTSKLMDTLRKIGDGTNLDLSLAAESWSGGLAELKESLQNAAEAVGDAWNLTIENIKQKAASAQKAFANLLYTAAAAGKNLLAAAASAVPVISRLSGLEQISWSLSASLKHLGNALRQSLMNVSVGNGIALIRQEMSAYLAVDQQFVSALARMRGVLLTAFQPIYEAVLPALVSLINFAASAIAAVSQFTAALFGTSAKKAQSNAAALYQQAHALNAVGSAAKKAQLAVAPFDEFNILNFHESGGSGGAGGFDMPDFSYDYDAPQFDSWGEAFSAFLDKLLDGIPKLENAFKKFADWLNDFSRKLYDMFTFPGVLEKVERLGRDLAGAFNKLVNWIDWNQLGKALGAGLNLALQFLTELIYGFDWLNLGKKLAAFVNGLLAEIDWFDFGRLLWAGFKTALETFAGFILGLDMPLLAHAASSTMLGFFSEMLSTIQRIPWSQIGSQIAVFFNNIQWFDIITAVLAAASAAFSALFEMLRAFVNTLQWHDIAVQIYSAVNQSIGSVDWFSIGQTLGNAFIQAVTFLREIIAGIDWYQIGADVGRFLTGIDWVGAMGALAQIIAAGIGAAIQAARGFLDTVAPHIQDIAHGIAEKINEFFRSVDWAAVGQVISSGLELALDFALEFMRSVDWNAIGSAIVTLLENIDWPSLLSKWSELVGEAMTARLAAINLDGIVDAGRNIVEGLLQGILDKIASVESWLKENLVDPIVNGVKELLGIHSPSTVFAEIGQNLVAGLLQGISESWSSIVGFFSEKLEGIRTSVTTTWENIRSASASAWEAIKNAVGSVWVNLQCSAAAVFSAIQNSAASAWSFIASDSAEKWEQIRNGISDKINALISKVSEGFSQIKTDITGKISGAIEELKNKDWISIGTNIVDGILTGLRSIFNQLSGWASKVWSSITSSFSNSNARASVASSSSKSTRNSVAAYSLAADLPGLQSVRLPKLANGAVIPPNQQFAAILGDQRRGVNIEAPLATIEKAVENVLMRGGFGGDIHVTVESVLDGKVVARNTVRHINDMTASAGKPVLLF